MNFSSRFFAPLAACGLLVTAVQSAFATDPIVWQQSINFSNFSDWGPSSQSSEVADDFDLVGTVTRIDVNGYGVGTKDAAFSGVYIRFYAYGTDAKPGALQQEFFIPKNDPRILNQVNSSDFQIALGSAFQASGKHFVSVQTSSGSTEWFWRSANEDAPRGPALYFRASPQSQWTHTVPVFGTANADTAFTLYGTRTLTGPTLSALSATTLAQAGRLIISGSGFGEQKGTGVVQIGGSSAPVSKWADNSITAYVPDAAPLSNDNVQVVTTGGASNTLALQVTARPAQVGQVKWRFMADDLYIQSRPAVAADGTVYAAGVGGHLYALTPTGGLKWIFSAGNPNALQPVSVGPDGTVYFSVDPTIYAVNPDGTLKWSFTDPAFVRIFAGPTVGPDGNIYAVSEDYGFPNGLGAFVLSPAGTKISNLPGFSTRSGYGGIEIVFGPLNHWYFTNNAAGAVTGAGSLWAFPLGNTNLIWYQGAVGQPRVQPSGNIVVGDGNLIHPGLQAFDQNGALLWRSLGELPGTLVPGVDAQTALDVGTDGNIYVGTLTFGAGRHLTSLNPDGTLRWQFRDDGTGSSPAVSPLNTSVLFTAYDFSAPSRVHSVSTAGILLWTENLPAENGGFVHTISVPRFSPDGLTGYIGTDVNDYATNPYSYLYAFDTSGGGTTTDVVNISSAVYTTSRQQLQVQATSSATTATLQVFVTSTDTLIGTLTKRNGKYIGKFTWSTNPVNITIKSSAGGSASKAVTTR
ncbi:MAG: PQQ-binding-like beta-propeller repeat protein [Chthoniobacterales bacterium]